MKKGFTLIEILIVLAVIGVLAAALMVRAVNLGPDAKNKRAENDLRLIKLAIEAYIADTGRLPDATDADQLEVRLTNASKRLIDYIPNDPWGTEKYGYATDGGNPPTYYVIYSVGKNGVEEITGVSASSGGEVQVSDTTDDIWVSNCRKKNSNMP
jgi:type II secretion system protein G